MRILIISNMYPSRQKASAGIFVKNQYEYLKSIIDEHDEIDIYYMKRRFTTLMGSLIKYAAAFLAFTPYYFRRYHVIHVHFFYPLYILAYIYKRIHPRAMIVVTFHGGDITRKIKGRISRWLFARIARKCDYAIAVGKDLSLMIESKLNLHVNAILCAGVDARIFYRMQLTEKKYDFIFVGSFIERKGIDILLKAIEIVGDKDIRYCFAGSGPYLNMIRRFASTYNIEIRIDQTQDQLRELYNQSRYFLFPSRDEPFGLVATEALYCGTPVILSRSGGLKEQVVDGHNGIVMNEITPYDIAMYIKKALFIDQAEYERLSRNAEMSNRECSLDTICRKIREVYRNLSSAYSSE